MCAFAGCIVQWASNYYLWLNLPLMVCIDIAVTGVRECQSFCHRSDCWHWWQQSSLPAYYRGRSILGDPNSIQHYDDRNRPNTPYRGPGGWLVRVTKVVFSMPSCKDVCRASTVSVTNRVNTQRWTDDYSTLSHSTGYATQIASTLKTAAIIFTKLNRKISLSFAKCTGHVRLCRDLFWLAYAQRSISN